MKDLYTFDISHEQARHSYDQVNEIYTKLFKTLNVPFVRVEANNGSMGGSVSHEFQLPASMGESEFVTCSTCQHICDSEVVGETQQCPSCKGSDLARDKGIEVAHAFLLGEKYTKAFGAWVNDSQKVKVPLSMGCFGIGVTRLLAASIEVLSTENHIRWPFLLAPFTVCIIPPKKGSKEEGQLVHCAEEIYNLLKDVPGLQRQILLDDRSGETIGKRLRDAKK